MKPPAWLAFLPPHVVPMSLTTTRRTRTLRARRTSTTSSTINTPATLPLNQIWRKITVPDRYLRLSQTLHMGQAFRWRPASTPQPTPQPTPNATPTPALTREWAGCINQTLYILRQAEPEPSEHEPDPVYYLALPTADEATAESQHAVLVDYLRANVDYTDLFAQFRRTDAVFDRVFPYFRGVRTIRHDPVECLFSYICSSNNHMKRIGTMVNHLADTYGTHVATYAGQNYSAFPSVETLAEKATAADLREAGFGYRASYVVSTANALVQLAERDKITPEEMLLGWRKLPRRGVEKKLIQFPGIGRKVAGCIALMSLDQLGEIPVDTHVWQMGVRYLPELNGKRLSKKSYDAIGECFRQKFGEETAGLAHNILFAAELDEFKEVVPGGVPDELWAGDVTKTEDNTVVKQETVSAALEEPTKPTVPKDEDNRESTGRKRRRRKSAQ